METDYTEMEAKMDLFIWYYEIIIFSMILALHWPECFKASDDAMTISIQVSIRIVRLTDKE